MSHTDQRRIPALDGIRGIAIILVILFHLGALFAGRGDDSILLRAFNGGWSGVNLFFVLSGYLITGLLLDSKNGPSYFKTFYIRRALRIFPLYILFVAFFVGGPFVWPSLVSSEAHDWLVARQFWFWAYLQNFMFIQGWGFIKPITHLWSLAIEEQYYLVWPLLVFLLERTQLQRLCFFIIAAVIFARPLILATGGLEPEGVYLHTLTRLDGIMFGSLLALVERGSLAAFADGAMKFALALGLAALAFGIYSDHGLPPFTDASLIYSQTGILLLSGAAVWAAVRSRGRWTSALENSVLRGFGKYSYAIYVFHWPILYYAGDAFLPRLLEATGGVRTGLIVSAAIALPVLYATGRLSWVLMESRFLSLKDRLAPREGTAV